MEKVQLKYIMKPGTKEKFIEEIYSLEIPQITRKENGCISYEFYTSCDKDEILLIEKWENKEALSNHIETPHLKKLRELKEIYKIETIPAEI
jgi:quinol monooxygenase YgiN